MAQPHPHSPASTIASLSDDDKHHLLSYLPPDVKLIAVAPARIYHSAFGASADSWSFTGLRGMLVFGRDRTNYHERQFESSLEPRYWFRLVDVDGGKGIVWFHPIPSDLDYHTDKPFFHTFSGCSRMFGFRFDEDEDAEKFRKRITSRIEIAAPRPPPKQQQQRAFPQPVAFSPASATSSPHARPLPDPFELAGKSSPPRGCFPLSSQPTVQHQPRSRSPSPQPQSQRSPREQRKPLVPGMISAPTPGSFVHMAHVGLDGAGRIEASTPAGGEIEPGWTMILEELHGCGVASEELALVEEKRDSLDFIEGFLAGAKASLVQELRMTSTAPRVKRSQADAGFMPRPMQRKRVPVYY